MIEIAATIIIFEKGKQILKQVPGVLNELANARTANQLMKQNWEAYKPPLTCYTPSKIELEDKPTEIVSQPHQHHSLND